MCEESIILGENTSILMYNGSSKMVQDLKIGDKIITPCGHITDIKDISSNIELINEISVIYGRQLKCNSKTKFITLNVNNHKHPSHIKNKFEMIEDNVQNGWFLFYPNINICNDLNFSIEWAWLFGLFASNGRILYKYGKPSGITFFSKFKNEVFNIIKSNFPCASVRKSKKLITVTGKEVVDFFTNYIIIDDENKRLSIDLIWMNKNLQLEFLRGWFSNKGVHESNKIIGCDKYLNIIEAISFMLVRNDIPFSIRKTVNYRIEIASGNGKKLFDKFLIKKKKTTGKNSYRRFNGILFPIKDIKKCKELTYKIKVDNGLIANGYAIVTNKNNNNVYINSKCSICNKKLIFSEQNICIKCREKKLLKLSWRYQQLCKHCNKKIKNCKGNQKYCSEKCRQLAYDPLIVQNNGKSYQGYVNKGFFSYSQRFIYLVLKDTFKDFEWTYNDRRIIRNPNTNYPMELDIWCKDLNFAIEFDGPHHYKNCGYGNLKYTQLMDEIKNNECQKNGISLLRISYKDDHKNKEWILKKVGEFINDNN